jgi:DNA-directed RNA polymerase, mitochondrial
MTGGKLLAGSILDEEIALETRAIRDGVERYRDLAAKSIERGDGASLKPAERLLLHWYEPMTLAVKEEQRSIRKGEPEVGRGVHGPPLLLIDPERTAVLVIREVLGACMAEPTGLPVTRLAYSIGRSYFGEANLDLLREEDSSRRTARRERIEGGGDPKDHPDEETLLLRELDRRVRNLSACKVNWWAKKTLTDPVWNRRACLHVGMQLLWLLIGIASAADYQQEFKLAFHVARRRSGRKFKSYLTMDQAVHDLIEQGHEARQFLRPRYLPMIVPPYPWTAEAQGGYVHVRTPFVSKPTPEQKAALKAADLTVIHDALNTISGTPWRVNANIRDTVCKLWLEGGNVAGIPGAEPLPKPPQPPDMETNQAAKRAWKKAAAKVYTLNIRGKADRREFLHRLSVATDMHDREAFYFPHQLDFRGRGYPIPPHLNHQGNDICRGLLEFSEEKTSDDSAWWSLVHAANCAGFDKEGFDERVEWSRRMLPQFERIARSPLDTVDIWTTANGKPIKKPFQFLAACIAAVEEGARRCVPVQVDGTANGLQHFAALGRDRRGAAVVNLSPGARPNDIYGDVAEDIRPVVESDARSGNAIASLCLPFIDRDVTKPNVMTTPYGVTQRGAKDQVRSKLKRSDDRPNGLEGDDLWNGSMYLSGVIMDSISRFCASATTIMAYLKECAVQITKTGETVRWVTPLGFPVVQPYRRLRHVQIFTVMHRVTVAFHDEALPVDVRDQCDGIAPNYVHSLDSTHMFMVARRCKAEGITFAAVHDSFWTHAATMTRLCEILREEFVNLHRRPLLQELVAQFRSTYPGVMFPEPPPPGDFDIEEVLKSRYIFS